MRSTALVVLLAVSAAIVLPTTAAESSPAPPAPSNLETLQFLAWNRSGTAVDLEVRLNDEVVFRESVSSSDIPSALSAGKVVQRPAGAYSLEVIDHTRNLKESARIDVSQGGPNFGVHLIPNQVALVLSHQRLHEFTPGTAPGRAAE